MTLAGAWPGLYRRAGARETCRDSDRWFVASLNNLPACLVTRNSEARKHWLPSGTLHSGDEVVKYRITEDLEYVFTIYPANDTQMRVTRASISLMRIICLCQIGSVKPSSRLGDIVRWKQILSLALDAQHCFTLITFDGQPSLSAAFIPEKDFISFHSCSRRLKLYSSHHFPS